MLDFISTENLINIIQAFGYFGIFAIIFAESGLFFGFFLPGDSLLFTIGFLASQNYLDLTISIIVIFFGAVLGDNFGYYFGKKVGPKIFSKEESLFFHKDNLEKAQTFYEEHGAKTIVLARFVPIVRTFAPILAGVGKMKYKKFLFYNIWGGLFWTILITGAGCILGKIVPDIDQFLFPIILIIILISFLPATKHLKKRIKK
jgi:membrane-associated protein